MNPSFKFKSFIFTAHRAYFGFGAHWFFILMLSCSPLFIWAQAPLPVVLFVVGNPAALNASETAIKARFESRGFDVSLLDDNASAPGDADGKALIVISSTVSSGNVGTKFRDSAVPILNWESALPDDLLMTGAAGGTDYGEGPGHTDIIITDPTHPVAAGLAAGQHTVVTSPQMFTWGVPSATSANVIATLADGTASPCLYGYEKGALLIDATTPAPERRLHIFLQNDVFAALNTNGLKLFDAVVSWVLNRSLAVPPSIQITSPTNNASFSPSAHVNIFVQTGGGDGAVSRVEFFNGSTKIGESSNAPFTFTWTNAPAGNHALTAKATATTGASSVSDIVTIKVGNPPPTILFIIADPANPNASEAAVKTRLESFGFQVALLDDNLSATSDAAGKNLIVISSTVSSGNVGAKYRTVAVPVLNWESALPDDFLMTGTVGGTDYGEGPGHTDIIITEPTHPMAAGLAGGQHTVVTSPQIFTWGMPSATSAQVIATLADGSASPCLYGYEKGALLIDNTTIAPERRVHIFLQNDVFAALNEDGLKLFDATVGWALNRPLGSVGRFDPPVLANGIVTIRWTGEGTLQEATSIAGPWQNVANPVNPFVMNPTTPARFFRLKQ